MRCGKYEPRTTWKEAAVFNTHFQHLNVKTDGNHEITSE
jgi:hypothetical protein